jgi:hypothetical protein
LDQLEKINDVGDCFFVCVDLNKEIKTKGSLDISKSFYGEYPLIDR